MDLNSAEVQLKNLTLSSVYVDGEIEGLKRLHVGEDITLNFGANVSV